MVVGNGALAEVMGRLADVAVQIRDLEAEAAIFLHQHHDSEASTANMRRKAELLAEMPDMLESCLEGLAPKVRERVERGAEGFARRGLAALEQGSVFWMRNLLYPEDYAEGEPNDLERFITSLVSGDSD